MSGTVQTIPYLLNTEFADGQPNGAIVPQNMRDLIVTFQSLFGSGVLATSQAASYTLQTSDAGTLIEFNSTTAVNLIVPLNSSVAFPIGTIIDFYQQGAGQVTVVPASSGVSLLTAASLTTRTQNATCTMRKRANDQWVIGGDLQ